MDLPITKTPHTPLAIALIAKCLQTYETKDADLSPLIPQLQHTAETGEVAELITSLAFVGATLALAVSRQTALLAEFEGVVGNGFTADEVLMGLLGG